MKAPYFIKKLTFPIFPLTYVFIEYDYSRAETISDMVALFYTWESTAKSINNPIAKTAYETASKNIFSEITGISYSTKKFKQI
ncbi:MAG: hypothetical protein QM499_01240 [Flavobacteriaceae bacterium]